MINEHQFLHRPVDTVYPTRYSKQLYCVIYVVVLIHPNWAVQEDSL